MRCISIPSIPSGFLGGFHYGFLGGFLGGLLVTCLEAFLVASIAVVVRIFACETEKCFFDNNLLHYLTH